MININPFTPNFGQIPLHIAGRDIIISDIMRALDAPSGNPAQTSILVGSRGTGKTALLSYFAEQAQAKGWLSVNVNCVPGVQEDILERTIHASEEFLPAKARKHIKSLKLGNILTVDLDSEASTEGNWRTKMTAILDELNKLNKGLFITIDEISPDLDEMIQIASVYQLWLREGRKVSLLMAGLPSGIFSLINSKSVSFLRRASQYTLERIPDHEIEKAFIDTLDDSEKTVTQDALPVVVNAIAGFPYMLQLVGYRAWEAADDTIDIKASETGIAMAAKDFESRVLIATLQELSDVDRSFLTAMLPDSDISDISDIQCRMSKSSGYISQYRARLLESGVIESRGRGKVAFALPGLREYLIKTQ